jgi:hypothetical protein
MDSMEKTVKAGMLAVFLSLGGVGLTGCDDGPFEEAGEEIDEAVDDMRDTVDDVEDNVDP